MGDDDLEARVLLAHPGLGVGQVAAVPEAHPGRSHRRPPRRPARPGRRHGLADPPAQRAHDGAHGEPGLPLPGAAQHGRLGQQLHGGAAAAGARVATRNCRKRREGMDGRQGKPVSLDWIAGSDYSY